MAQKWQSLAELQQQAAVALVPIEPESEAEAVEPPAKINDTGRAAIELLKRWRANSNDDGAAVGTLLAVWGTQSSIGRIIANWTTLPAPKWLAEIAHANGARLVDMGSKRVLRSSAAAEMIRHRINRQQGKRSLEPMGFQTHAALLGYWRERRELLNDLRGFTYGKEAHRTALMLRSVRLLVQRLEERNVRIMSRGGGRDGQ